MGVEQAWAPETVKPPLARGSCGGTHGHGGGQTGPCTARFVSRQDTLDSRRPGPVPVQSRSSTPCGDLSNDGEIDLVRCAHLYDIVQNKN
jgi:hypothetical protein